MRRVAASAPTRIDLAGGTLDIPPLDILVPGACTVNAAISLTATAEVETIDAGFRLRSDDRGIDHSFACSEELAADRELPLLAGMVGHFARGPGISLRTACSSPAGAGLGGSSALAVAAAAALARFAGAPLAEERLLAVARDMEVRVLGVPTGVQDFMAAIRGGVLSLEYRPGGPEVESLCVDLAALRERTVLVFTGAPRSSGINNWEVTRAFVDGDPEVRLRLEGIARQAARARDAIRDGDLDRLAEAVEAEMAERRGLAPGIATEEVERLLEAGRAAGALAGKVCGAGGGGCVVLLTAAGRRAAVEEAAGSIGMQVLDFEFAASGLSVTAEPSGL